VKLLGQFFDSLEFLIEILGQYSLSRLVHVGWDGLCEACRFIGILFEPCHISTLRLLHWRRCAFL
jgi:hypothetical protein